MTRKQADELVEGIPDLYSQDYMQSVVDDIYDHLESRACDNCKLFMNKKGHIDCILAIQTQHLKGFSCSLWEPKDT
jgi:hypothetical protein